MTGLIGGGGAQLNVANTWTAQQTADGATGTSPGWYAQITGDTTPRVRVGMNAADMASLAFGPGNAVRDLFLERAAAASLRLGNADAAAPVAQTFNVQGVITGTTDTAGASLTLKGSVSTGTGVGGSFVFQTSPATTTGNTPNAFATAFTIGSATVTTALPATLSGNGAASVSPLLMSGTLLTGGTATTNFPALFAQPTGTAAVTSWSTSGTIFGVNAVSGFAGNFFDFHIAGAASVGSLSSAGNLTVSGSFVSGSVVRTSAGGAFTFSTTRSAITSASDGVIEISNAANTDFSRLQFGGTTSSFPSLKRSSVTVQGRLADDSAFTFVQAKLQTDTNATTGLTAGVLAAITNASIVLYDASGQAYRVPCII